jgi:hypothetical protein
MCDCGLEQKIKAELKALRRSCDPPDGIGWEPYTTGQYFALQTLLDNHKQRKEKKEK